VKQFRHDLLVAFFAVVATVAFVPIFTYFYFASDLASKESLVAHNDSGVVLFDRKDRPFFSFYKGKLKKEVSLSEIPKITQQAVIAIEDKDFYKHGGFSLKAIFRALIDDLIHKDLAYGASTLTQQLVKNTLLTSKKDFLRKFQEVVLASEIERRYKKDEILEMYLSSVYFGEGAFGIEEASQTYFGKSVKDLSLAESSMLVGLLPAPTQLSPLSGHFEEAKLHQKLVLERMEQQKYVTAVQKDEASKQQLDFNSRREDINNLAPHFALGVLDELKQKYGEETIIRSGFKVHTTLDLDFQKYAEKVVSEQVDKLKANRVTNGAVVAMDPKTGEILAMVGSKDWYDDKFGKVNIALSPRPPGSSFKPIVYLRGFEKGMINPSTILQDSPTKFANFDENKFFSSFPTKVAAQEFLSHDPNAYYSPQDYDRKFRGPVTVRRALSNSLNVPAVAVMKKVGLDDGIEMGKRLGLSTLKEASNYGLSLVLGTADVKLVELTNVYATLSNSGLKNDPTTILEIEDKSGKSIYKYTPKQDRVADEKDVFLISSILSDNKARSEMFGNALTISRPAAVKTGTTEDYKDAWTLGYTPSLAVGVWVGNNFGEPMDRVAGSLGAAPIWKLLMENFLQGTPVEEFIPPYGVVKLNCLGNLKEASSSAEYFVKGTEPKGCSSSQLNSTPNAIPTTPAIPKITILPANPPNNGGQSKKNKNGDSNNND